jgi:asparagine synthase (glutamine-hydrolysing)
MREAFVACLDAEGGTPRLAGGQLPGGTPEVLCVVVGRITNLEELADGTADAEHALATAYRRWGDDVVSRCAGQFAVLIWDRVRRRGFVARDALGHRAVFYAHRGRALVVASEVRPLLGELASRPAPDPVAVAHWLAGTGVPGGRTLYDGVHRLPPGHLLALGAEPARPRRHWQPRTAAPDLRTIDEAAGALREAMAGAVERALGDAQAPAVLLSGGFDSSSVAALAARASPRCYSTVFPRHPEVDESPAIAATRDHCGLVGVERRFLGGGALAAAVEFVLVHELPSASPNGFLWRPLLRRAAADGVTVMLDGEGGDEMFGCAPMLIADRLRRIRLRQAVALARRIPGMGDEPPVRWVRRALVAYGVRGALPPRLHDALRRARSRRDAGDWLRPELRRAHDECYDRWAFKRRRGPRWRESLVDLVVNVSDALGAHDHFRREAELSGLELRHPFRDPQLLDTALAIEPSLHFDPYHDRPVARRAMAGLLPDPVRLSERKPHFNAVLADALAIDAAPVRELLGDPRAEVRAYVRPAVLDDRLAAYPTRLAPRDLLTVWRAVGLECWLRVLAGQEEALRTLGAVRPAPADQYVESAS